MDNSARELFLHIADQASSMIAGDPLAEFSDVSDYSIQQKAIAVSAPEEDRIAAKDCHSCDRWRSRRIYASPVLHKEPLILFIAPYPEGDRIFSPESQDYFHKWQLALHLSPDEIALSAIMRCPSSVFDPASADLCKAYLREEMAEIRPANLVILSEAASRYMTRCRDGWDRMRSGRSFNINRIPSYCCSSPSELISGSVSKREVWNDLKAIAKAIGIENRL